VWCFGSAARAIAGKRIAAFRVADTSAGASCGRPIVGISGAARVDWIIATANGLTAVAVVPVAA
jgi:hypothetical protein